MRHHILLNAASPLPMLPTFNNQYFLSMQLRVLQRNAAGSSANKHLAPRQSTILDRHYSCVSTPTDCLIKCFRLLQIASYRLVLVLWR